MTADDFLDDLIPLGAQVAGRDVLSAATAAGVPHTSLRRAATRIGIEFQRFGRRTIWARPNPLKPTQSTHPGLAGVDRLGTPYGGAANQSTVPIQPRTRRQPLPTIGFEPDDKDGQIWKWTGPGEGPDWVPLRYAGTCFGCYLPIGSGRAGRPGRLVLRVEPAADGYPEDRVYVALCSGCCGADPEPRTVSARLARIFEVAAGAA
jgi:hypothetical protein